MIGFWHWLVLGVVLVSLEAVLPGVFLVWLGLAALATGLILLPLPPLLLLPEIPWEAQLALFAVLSVALVLVGVRLDKKSRRLRGASVLNRRGHRHIGKELVLEAPITGGSKGKVSIGDTIWHVTGPALASGTQVRVTGVDGAVLVVEPLGETDASGDEAVP